MSFTCPNVGDLIEFDRGIYKHWGVYIGEDEVVHLTGDELVNTYTTVSGYNILSGTTFTNAVVKRENINFVADGRSFRINNGKDGKLRPKYPGQIRKTALEYVNRRNTLDILSNNCEHFASFCRYGKPKSDQADSVASVAMAGVVAVGFVLLRAVLRF